MNWPLMCPPDLPGSAVGLRVLTTDLTFRRKPLPGFKWPLILIDWFMCFGALVCILYIFNRVQSCSIHIQFVHNDTRFSEPAASKIYRSQENSLKKQPLANTGHCEFSLCQSHPTVRTNFLKLATERSVFSFISKTFSGTTWDQKPSFLSDTSLFHTRSTLFVDSFLKLSCDCSPHFGSRYIMI